jgi:hypothetical protein
MTTVTLSWPMSMPAVIICDTSSRDPKLRSPAGEVKLRAPGLAAIDGASAA